MPDISEQTQELPERVNQTVQESMNVLNNLTSNVTTIEGDSFSYFYNVFNYTELDPGSYPFNQTLQDFQNQLNDAKEAITTAIDAQVCIIY